MNVLAAQLGLFFRVANSWPKREFMGRACKNCDVGKTGLKPFGGFSAVGRSENFEGQGLITFSKKAMKIL